MGITRLHNFEHRNKAYFKVFKVEYVKLFVLGKSHKQMFFLCDCNNKSIKMFFDVCRPEF